MLKRTSLVMAVAVLASSAAFGATSPGNPVVSRGFLTVQHYDRWDDAAANINEREAHIRSRIDRGINDGRITRREAHRLFRELGDIEAKERSFRADGRIDRRENRILTADLERLADHVRQQTHDEQRY